MAWRAQRFLFSGSQKRSLITALEVLCSLVLGLSTPPCGATEFEAKSSDDLVRMGDEAFETGRYSAAVDLYRSALNRDEANFAARAKLIELLARLAGREDEARREMDIALAMKTLGTDQLRQIAEICLENGFPDRAKLVFQATLTLFPEDASALENLVALLLTEKKTDEAKQTLETYCRDANPSIEALKRVAASCLRRLQYDLARIAYETVLAREERNPEGLLGVSRCLLGTGRLPEAVERLSQAAEWHPERAEISVALGELLLRKGEYEKAEQAFQKALTPESESEDAAVGYAEVLRATGRYPEARQALDQTLKTSPDSPALRVSLGELLDYVGEDDLARQQFEKALEASPGYPKAILGLGRIFLESGQREAAQEHLHRLYDFWDAHVADLDAIEPGDMIAVAVGCALTDNPQDAVSVLERALKKDPTNTEALLWEARLFLERHQPGDATRELSKLLSINPHHAEAHAELAAIFAANGEYDLATESCRKALESNPKLIRGMDILSSIQLLDFQYEAAEETAKKALEVNPRSLSSLSHLASCFYQQRKKDAYEEVRKKVFAINPAYSEFYSIVARACEEKRRNEEAMELLKEAIVLRPDDAAAHTKMGVLLMREGEEEQAEQYLRKSYRLDPYNPRTTNFINLLDYIKRNFVSWRTEHFLLRWDKEKGRVLESFLPGYIEQVYRDVCGEFGYEPRNPTLVEIFESHDQFSARIVGLPFIATVGASLGKLVAMDSPKSGAFDWKDVLRHEFVHVVNLQQTNMQIPFWFTEGLATLHEDSPLPAEWDGLLQRMLYLGEIIPVKDLNSCFTRPRTQLHKQAAYAESRMICRYLDEKFGRDVVRKMISYIGQNISTEEVIPQVLSISVEEFEQKIADYILAAASEQRIAPLFLPGDGELMERLRSERPADALLKVAQARLLAEEALRARPPDPAKLDQATQIVAEVIEKDPQARGAYATLAGIHLFREKYTEALDAAQKALAADEKDFLARRYLGFTYERMNEPQKAAEELERAAELYPRADEVWLALHALYTNSSAGVSPASQKDQPGTIRALRGRLRANPRDVPALKTIAEAYLANRDHLKAIELLEKGLRYNLYDGELYSLLVDAYEGTGRWKTARRYAEIGSEAAYISAASLVPYQKEKVLSLLKLALKLNPGHEKAQSLLGQVAQ
ncbi:MAG: tetratricopeptide repeat protein [bacterium]|nr:tetratricopeptide repeat protein [bacterium]